MQFPSSSLERAQVLGSDPTFFMFIVGVAMPFDWQALEHRRQLGGNLSSCAATLLPVLLFGWGYCIGPGKLTFELWNVLAQLSSPIVAFHDDAKVERDAELHSLRATRITELAYPVASAWIQRGFCARPQLRLLCGPSSDGKLSRGHW